MARTIEIRRLIVIGVTTMTLAIGLVASFPAQAAPTASQLEPRSLLRAKAIRAQVDGRYRALRGGGLNVTEASSTGVLESFALLTADLTEARNVPADNGIYYAICPPRASCPYPADRFARPAADAVSRRMALELVLRTFLETSADLVAVSLPTPRFIALVVERTELAREIDLATLSASLRGSPARGLSASLEGIVDRLTRPRIYVGMWLDPTPSGGVAWVGMLRWRM